ncbi:hypothetical protein DP107_06960 [Haloglomus irregulare]|uniref:Uncharacterized protein n=1 Tax=Haloglomus irregulare TaxID=2234134 RepID=A0A554NBF1_9EURY|nr:hypothetical protein [Haloglomus irregulare]TSD14711.1 hypothetical protein DP107_06960 [Haloglomus irregulare]
MFGPDETTIYRAGEGGEEGILVLVDRSLSPSARRRATRDLCDRTEALGDRETPVRVGTVGVIDPDEWSRRLRGADRGAVRIDSGT